jgi:hypothetical protein
MSIHSRKVLEVLPRLHEHIKDAAHARRVPLNQLATVLAAYAAEHIEEAIHEADRLLAEWEGPISAPDWPPRPED